jgi:flavin-dependent dehydrogenase
MELHAKYTCFAEGCRGHLGKQLEAKFKLRDGADPQTYGIGIKELWEVKPEHHQPASSSTPAAGRWTTDTYGGGFLYHLEDNLVAVGFVVGLGYSQPAPVALRGVPALQDASGNPQVPRRRQAHRLRRARDHRRRPAVACPS